MHFNITLPFTIAGVVKSVYRLGYGLEDLAGKMRYFLFATASRPALGATQPPVQWVPGSLPPGLKRTECEPGHLRLSSADG
jgi:hypothetical protein